jgi:uncharacterized protein YbaR (Trm112 family)
LDLLACPRCGGRLKYISTILDPRVARRILEHLRMPARAPPELPASDPSAVKASHASSSCRAPRGQRRRRWTSATGGVRPTPSRSLPMGGPRPSRRATSAARRVRRRAGCASSRCLSCTHRHNMARVHPADFRAKSQKTRVLSAGMHVADGSWEGSLVCSPSPGWV